MLKKCSLSRLFPKATTALLLSFCIVAVMFGISSAQDAQKSAISLSAEEQAWIAAHPKIRIANEMDWPPFSFVENGKAVGFSTEYIKLIAAKTGLNIDWVTGYSWNDLVKMAEREEVDILHSLTKSEEREKFLNFTSPYHTSFEMIVTRPEDSSIRGIRDLVGRKIAVVEGFSTESELQKAFPQIRQVKVSSTLEGLTFVSLGKADAFIGTAAVSHYFINKFKIPNLIFAALEKELGGDTTNLRIGVRKSWPELAAILEKGMKAISAYELNSLETHWFGTQDNSTVSLNPEEKDWVRENPVVRVAATPDWPPFEFRKNSRHAGIAADILQIVAERAGLKLAPEFGEWRLLMGKLQNGELDLSPGMVMTPARANDFLFTDPFFVSRVGIWVESSKQGIHSMNDLGGKTVAVENGYSTHETVLALYPDIKLYLVKSPIEAILAVSSGQVDAYLGNLTSTQYLMGENVITNLKVAGYFEEAALDLRMGVNKSKPVLVGILNKALATLTPKEKSNLLSRYVGNASTAPVVRERVSLTVEEKKWIAQHKGIRLGVDLSWPPFEYVMGETHSGLSAEYVKQLSQDTGLVFAPPPIVDWTDVIRMAKEEQLDVLPGLVQSPEREKYLAFSKPYGSFPIVIYQRTNDQPVKNIQNLDGKSVAVVKGSAFEELFRENHPDEKITPYITIEKAIRALSDGHVDALVGNVVAVEYAKQQQSIFNIAPTLKTPYVQELRFGVRQDWGILVQIIDKWLASIDKAARDRMAQAVDVKLDIPVLAEGTKEPVDFIELLFVGGGIILAFGTSLIILLFMRRFIRSRAETLYSSHQYKIVGIVVGLLFLCMVVIATWYALSRLQNRARQEAGEAMESVLLATHEALSIWERLNELHMKELVDSPALRGLTNGLFSLPENKAAIEGSPQLRNIRKFMEEARVSRGFVEFSIISKNFLNYATSDNDDLLDKNIVSIQRPRMLDRAFLGDTIFVPPIKVESNHIGEHGDGNISLVGIATPIKGPDEKVIAVLILYFDVDKTYQRIVSMGRMGRTGETYLFDKYGNLASESRFEDQLRALGLIGEKQKGILNLHIADPGGNLLEGYPLNKEGALPMTVSAKSATAGNSGHNLQGYRDYRGIPVLGVWLWDDNLGLGFVTEMEASEALGSYRLVRNTVVTIILITILLGSFMTGLSNWIGQSAAKSLSKAKEELEDRVEQRTAELKKTSVAVEQSPVAVVITDVEGTIQYVNPMFSKTTGYTSEEAIGRNPKLLKSGLHPIEFYQKMWDDILSGQVWTGDLLNRKKSGELFWERTSIAPISNDAGVLTHFVAVKLDITQSKAQEERFQALLDAAPDAMVIISKSGEITLVNVATEELFGYSREVMLGNKVEMLLPEYVRAMHPAHRDKFIATPGDMSLLAGKEFYGETKNGELVPVDISLNPIETEDGVQIIASIRDITERKKAEAAIAESEERTRLILSSAGEGIFGVNLKGNVVFINDAACAMLGYSSDEFMGMSVHELIHHSRPDGDFYPEDECPMRHAFVEGVSSRVDDEVLWRKDGTSFPVEYSAMPVNRGSEMIGAVISFQDITERKSMEEALLTEKEKTEDALGVVTSSIQYASRIQRSILPQMEKLEQFTSEYFVVWEPRDVVGGDLYWAMRWGRGVLIMLGDCTGHGVPGAFMTLLATGAMERALLEVPPGDAARLISRIHQMMQVQLGQDSAATENGSDDGLELGVCHVIPKKRSLVFAGARMPLFIDNGQSIEVVKSDKKGIAYCGIPFDFEYTNHEIEVADGMRFFMTTDGVIDQIGGEKARGFGKKRFISLLESLRSTPMAEMGDKIHAELCAYQGDEKRRDDVSIIGFSI